MGCADFTPQRWLCESDSERPHEELKQESEEGDSRLEAMKPGNKGRTASLASQAESRGDSRGMLSQRTACILNGNDTEAHVEITILFIDVFLRQG